MHNSQRLAPQCPTFHLVMMLIHCRVFCFAIYGSAQTVHDSILYMKLVYCELAFSAQDLRLYMLVNYAYYMMLICCGVVCSAQGFETVLFMVM